MGKRIMAAKITRLAQGTTLGSLDGRKKASGRGLSAWITERGNVISSLGGKNGKGLEEEL